MSNLKKSRHGIEQFDRLSTIKQLNKKYY